MFTQPQQQAPSHMEQVNPCRPRPPKPSIRGVSELSEPKSPLVDVFLGVEPEVEERLVFSKHFQRLFGEDEGEFESVEKAGGTASGSKEEGQPTPLLPPGHPSTCPLRPAPHHSSPALSLPQFVSHTSWN